MTIENGANLKGVQEVILPGNVVAINVFYWKADFAETQTEENVADWMEGAVEAIYGKLLEETSDGVTLGDLRCYKRVLSLWDLFDTRAPDVTFTGVTDMLPQGVSALMRAYTVDSRVIGRKYMPGFTEATQVDGVLVSGALSSLAEAAIEWGKTRVISANNSLIGGIWSTRLLSVIVVSDVYVIPVNPGYQRRRRPGVGI